MEILRNLISNSFIRINEGFKQLPTAVSIALAALGSLGILYSCYRYYKNLQERKELLHAKNLLAGEQFSNALQVFRRLVINNPYHTDARLGEARCSYKLGRLDKAKRAYEVVLQREPQNVEALTGLSKISQKRGQGGTWRDVLEECEAAGCTSSFFYANALRRLGQADRTFEQFGHFNDAAGLIARAKILKDRNQLNQSVDLCSQACDLEPQNAKALRSYAYYLKEQGQNQEAIHYYKIALEINPLHSKSHLALIGLYIDLPDLEKAIQASQAFTDLCPTLPQFNGTFANLIVIYLPHLVLNVDPDWEKIKRLCIRASELYKKSPCENYANVIQNCDNLVMWGQRDPIILANYRELAVRKMNEAGDNNIVRTAWQQARERIPIRHELIDR